MNERPFQPHFRECSNPDCNFRYPVTEEKQDKNACPKCGAPAPITAFVKSYSLPLPDEIPQHPSVILVLDNLRSVFNVGSIFRSSDGAGIIEKMILCGTTPTPEHPKFTKTALGSEKNITWEYQPNTLEVCKKLKTDAFRLVALEVTPESHDLFKAHQMEKWNKTATCLIVGNEVAGIDPDVLALSDSIFHIPLHGIKESLNVAIAASIAVYTFYQNFQYH